MTAWSEHRARDTLLLVLICACWMDLANGSNSKKAGAASTDAAKATDGGSEDTAAPDNTGHWGTP